MTSRLNALKKQLLPTDVLLASFPRSGNTWLRFILADLLIAGSEPNPTDIIELNRTVFDIYKGLGEARFVPYRLIKTHEPHIGTDHRFIGLVRSPGDSIVSYFHFHRLHQHLAARTKDGVDAFVKETLPAWTQNVQSYIDAVDSQRPGILITYEDLHADPGATVGTVCDFIGIDATTDQLNDAIQRRSFRNLQQAEASRPLHPTKGPPAVESEKFFRKGKIGSGAVELSKETIDLIEAQAQPVYEEAVARAQRPDREG